MYSYNIYINKKEVEVRFGTWVMKRLNDDGISAEKIGEEISNNPFGFIAKLINYGIINAIPGRDESVSDINDVYDWLDSNGGIAGEDATEILNLFVKQLTEGVPETKKKAVIPKGK